MTISPRFDERSVGDEVRRWRLILGSAGEAAPVPLAKEEADLDDALTCIYPPAGSERPNQAQLGVALGVVHQRSPVAVAELVQGDVLERLGARQLLLEPGLLAGATPTRALAASLLLIKGGLRGGALEVARELVGRVARELAQELRLTLGRAAATGLRSLARRRRPAPRETDWPRTISANLRYYQPGMRTVIPVQRIGRPARELPRHHLILCLDLSTSMVPSALHAGILAAVLASVPGLKVTLLAFHTAVGDFSGHLDDPVELLFRLPLGGGTDIAAALRHACTQIAQPADSTVVLISDLCAGEKRGAVMAAAAEVLATGATMLALLAIGEEGGEPLHDQALAQGLRARGVPVLATSLANFPDIVTSALAERNSLGHEPPPF